MTHHRRPSIMHGSVPAISAIVAIVLALAAVLPAPGQERATLTNHRGPIRDVAFSPDCTKLATAGRDSTVRIWDVAKGTELAVLKQPAEDLCCVAFSPDGKLLATGNRGQGMHLYETTTWKDQAEIIREPTQPLRYPSSYYKMAFTSDGATLVTPCTEHGTPSGLFSVVRAWDVASRGELGHAEPRSGDTALLTAFALAPDDNTVATGENSGTIVLWDLKQKKEIRSWLGQQWPPPRWSAVHGLAFAPDGKTLAAAGESPVLALWDPANGKPKGELASSIKIARCIQFSPDGKLLAVGGDEGTLELWDVEAGKLRTTLKGHTAVVNAVVFSKDGKLLPTASADKTAKIWDVPAEAKK